MTGVARRHSIGVWLAGGTLACLLCLYHLSATLAGGVFSPADHDSFYHGRRILDAMADPLRMYQFDSRVHAPDGAWVTWPWAYDMLMAFAARGLVAVTGAREPMTVLAFIAPAWTFVNAALLLGIASRLRLSLPMQMLALLFFALSPLTQALHRVGMLDHHYIEYTFVLATLYLGLGWFENLADRRRAVLLAVMLGAAPAFHNGLFILQLPVLVTLGCLWILKRPIDRGGALAFALALVASTLLFLLPSEPFRRGDFSYYLQSWFHLYASACTALLSVLGSRLRFNRAGAAGVGVALVAMAVPALTQLRMGGEFLFGADPLLRQIAEFGSIPSKMAEGQWWPLTVFYSPLLWLLPFGIGYTLWRLRGDSSDANVYFAVQVVFGSFLMLQTFRLHYFGSFALIFPLCLLIDDVRDKRPARLVLATLAVVALAPCLVSLRGEYPLGTSRGYDVMRGVLTRLEGACRRTPGAVLADPNDAHFIRYHTDCSTIADNFLTTPEDLAKVRQVAALLAGPVADVLREAPYVRYILIKRADDLADPAGCELLCPQNQGLRRELLDPGRPAPASLRLLTDQRIERAGRVEPYLRLYEVVNK